MERKIKSNVCDLHVVTKFHSKLVVAIVIPRITVTLQAHVGVNATRQVNAHTDRWTDKHTGRQTDRRAYGRTHVYPNPGHLPPTAHPAYVINT